jgi:hypothetical protein
VRVRPDHKVHIYLEYHNVCPLVLLGPPTPSPASEYVPPLGAKGEDNRLWVRGVGGPSSDDWRKSLALCLSVYSVDLSFLQNEPTWQSAGCQLHTRESIERLSPYSERFINFLAEELAAFRYEGEHPLLSHSSHRTWTVAPLGQVTPAVLTPAPSDQLYLGEQVDSWRHTSSPLQASFINT